jgi:hypothetical protein
MWRNRASVAAVLVSLGLHVAVGSTLREPKAARRGAGSAVTFELVPAEKVEALPPRAAPPTVASRLRRRVPAPSATTNANEKANANGDAKLNGNGNANAKLNGNANANAKLNANANGDTKLNGNGKANANGDTKLNANANGDAKPNTAPKSSEAHPDLFAAAAIGKAAGIDLSAAPSEPRPRRGVGAHGGVGVGDFLAEDAARERVQKGMVAPRLRDLERRLEKQFDPPFAHVDVSNKRELFHKQFVARLGRPPTLRELPRGEDPTRESNQDKLKRSAGEPFFLGRRAEVFARQAADGTILELSVRVGSGFRAFDQEALDAVEKALAGRAPAPEDVRGGEVRTLWQLEATAYVVYSATPSAVFDESSKKWEWVYPLEKKVDRAVRLIAIY